MGSLSDSSRRESLPTPDLSNDELNKRLASLELENERLRVDLENLRIELNSKVAANQGLKEKMAVLHVNTQSVLQEKQRVQYNLKDVESRLTAAENSTKWHQQQLHQVQVNKTTLQIEIETYQGMLKQKQHLVADTIFKCTQINKDYENLVSKYKDERDRLQKEIKAQRFKERNENLTRAPSASEIQLSLDLSTKLEATEEELRETKAQLCLLDQRLLSTEAEKTSIENAFAKHRSSINSMEDNLQRLELERNELMNNLKESRFEVEKLKSEKDAAELTLVTSRQNQIQLEEAIFQLQTQLSKMIAQFKFVNIKNADLEQKVISIQETLAESKRLKLLFFNANSVLLRKLKKEKQKVKKLESSMCQKENIQRRQEGREMENSVENSLQQVLDENKELKEQLKSLSRVSEESIDEGYADGASLGSTSTNLPLSPALNPVLLMKINDILYKSKHLMSPIQTGVKDLETKIQKFKDEQNSKFQVLYPNCYNNRTISAVSSPNNTRTLV